MNRSGQGAEQQAWAVGEALARNALAPCPGAGQELAGGLGSAAPHPSASLTSQAVLRGKQASCLLPLSESGTAWGGVGSPPPQSLAETETKASLNKEPSKPAPASWYRSVRVCWDGGAFLPKGRLGKLALRRTP